MEDHSVASLLTNASEFQTQKLKTDLKYRTGVHLVDKSVVKGLRGMGFVIDIPDEWKIKDHELFYYRADYKKALIDDEHPLKKVVKPCDVMTILSQVLC